METRPFTIVLDNDGEVGETGYVCISFTVARLDGAALPAFDVVLSIYAENIEDLTNARPPLPAPRFFSNGSRGGRVRMTATLNEDQGGELVPEPPARLLSEFPAVVCEQVFPDDTEFLCR